MRSPFSWLVFGLSAVYILMASGAVEFENKTLERTELVERVVSVPRFHPDRLSAWFRGHWEALKSVPSRWSGTAAP